MPRETVVGNGRVAIAFDSNLNIRDFFYPRVGLENHVSGHELKMGIWADGEFQWVDKGWVRETKYMPETLVSRSLASHHGLGIHIETNDAVHSFSNVFLRKVMVSNLAKNPRKIRIFFTHDFHIYGDPVGDTVMHEPSLNVMIHYKRKRYFLVDGVTSKGQGIYQFATGYKELPGREGTWKDAEDGILSGNSIAQGSVDSAVSFELDLLSKSRGTLYYWIACGKSLKEVADLDARVKNTGVEHLLLQTENYWAAWVNKKEFNLSILPNEIIKAYKNSLAIMRSHADDQGGIIASLDSDIMQFNRDTYSYIWMRDGAIAAMAFDLAGFREPSINFFRFCNSVMDEEGFFHHKYSPDGSVGSSWLPSADSKGVLPIEEDETALVLYALWRHFQKYRDIEFIESVPNLIVKTTEFLLDYLDTETGLPKPCFDLWEERWGVFTWTAATVYAALIAAAKFRKVIYDRERYESLSTAATDLKKAMIKHLYDPESNRFAKAIYPDGSRDLVVDSSASAVFLYGGFDASEKSVEGTMDSIRDRLWIKTQVGGLARYENDEYQRVSRDVPGNPWVICTLWLARWQIACAERLGQLKEAMELLNWAVKYSLLSGVMAEQIHPYTGMPVSVSPLTWSHAEFVIAVCEYLQKHQEISSAMFNSKLKE
jgi:glucoamylase